MSLFPVNLTLTVPAAQKNSGEAHDVRIVAGKEVKVGDPAGPDVEEAQAAFLYIYNVYDKFFGAGYKLLATREGELGGVRDLPVQGMYGERTSGLLVKHQLERFFDALYQGSEVNAVYNVRNTDGSINDKKLNAALDAYNDARGINTKGGWVKNLWNIKLKQATWIAINKELSTGTVGNSLINVLSNTPSVEDLKGKVSNTKLRVMKKELYEDNLNVVRERALKGWVRGGQGIKNICVPVIIKDNDPVRRVLDDVHDLVGGVNKGFYVSWDDSREDLVVHGSINWGNGPIKKDDAEGKFKGLLKTNGVTADLDFEKELMSEIEGGIVGYATISVLQAASGDQINLETVRAKADAVRVKRYPGAVPQPVQITPFSPKAPEAPAAPSGSAAPAPEGEKPKPEAAVLAPAPEVGPEATKPAQERNIPASLKFSGAVAKALDDHWQEIGLDDSQREDYIMYGTITLIPEQYQKALGIPELKKILKPQ